MSKKDNFNTAKDLIFRAVRSDSKTERIELAKEALEICPQCTDAYVILSTDLEFSDRQKKILFLEEGLRVGYSSLGPRFFREHVGNFNNTVKSQPYMRVLFLLAIELQNAGQTESAITHYKRLLDLDVNDSQYVRYKFAPLLISIGWLDEAQELFKKLGTSDTCPQILYSFALLQFKTQGGSSLAYKALSNAIANNKYVIHYLLEHNFDYNSLAPDSAELGKRKEAHAYAQDWATDWLNTKGITTWIISCLLNDHQILRTWLIQSNLPI